jgi:hypothetical protein
MFSILRNSRASLASAVLLAVVLAGCSSMMMMGGVTLTGAQENPPVTTSASGTSSIKIATDGSVTGSIATTGIAGTAAHIHMAAMGKNGPVVVPFVRMSDNAWGPAAGARLSDAQYKAYLAGDLYVNVHSEANKGGEIRAQLKP